MSVAPSLPEKQTKRNRGESHPDDVIHHYAQRFGLGGSDLKQDRILDLLDSKINGDIFIAQQSKQIVALKAKVEGLLRFIERREKCPKK